MLEERGLEAPRVAEAAALERAERAVEVDVRVLADENYRVAGRQRLGRAAVDDDGAQGTGALPPLQVAGGAAPAPSTVLRRPGC